MNRLSSLACIAIALAASACAGPVEVTRTFTPTAAARIDGDQLQPVAVLRGDSRIPLPAHARVEADRAVLPRERLHVHKLAPTDVIEQDAEGRIVAVRSAGNPPIVIRFVPGTASSPGDSDKVVGQLVDSARDIPLLRTDAIEMRGWIESDHPIPGGGRVESTRSTGALVAGVVVLTLSYGPTAYVGASSSRPGDRILEAPLVGPSIDLAQRPGCVAPKTTVALPVDPCIGETATRAALVASGAVQGLAAVLTLVGLPTRSRVIGEGDHTVRLVPQANGAALVGTF